MELGTQKLEKETNKMAMNQPPAGAVQAPAQPKPWWFWVLLILGILLLCGCLVTGCGMIGTGSFLAGRVLAPAVPPTATHVALPAPTQPAPPTLPVPPTTTPMPMPTLPVPPKATPVPPTATPVPTLSMSASSTTLSNLAKPQPGEPLGLKYQPAGDGSCKSVSDPMNYPSCIIQRIQAGELTVEEGVVMIQQLGARQQAPSFEDTLITDPNTQPALFWCPKGIKGQYPPDSAFPLSGTQGDRWSKLLFVINKGVGGPDRIVQAADGTKCWAIYIK